MVFSQVLVWSAVASLITGYPLSYIEIEDCQRAVQRFLLALMTAEATELADTCGSPWISANTGVLPGGVRHM